jgi:restriction endonuclease S subunit
MDDIKDAFLVDDEVKYATIPSEEFAKYRLEHNDVLFNRVNSEEFVGRTGIFKLAGDYVFASYLIRIRTKPASQILPDYLNMFLNSAFGLRQIRKLSRRAVNQANVNAEELKRIKIAVLPSHHQEQIKKLCDESSSAFQASKRLYLEAENLLLDKIGFKNVDLSWSPRYAISAKGARTVGRFDAEHFQPKYGRLIKHLEKTGKAVKLGDIAPKAHRGAQPLYIEGGKVVVVNSQHLGRSLVNVEGCERTDEHDFNDNPKAHLRENDVLIYATGAYVGRTNVWLESMKAMASNHVTIVRPKKECDPRYLAVYLNSPLGILQADSWATGSAQRELYPEEISNFTVYLPSPSFQQKIAELVTAAYEARAKAKKLLEDAKRRVEELIEHRS